MDERQDDLPRPREDHSITFGGLTIRYDRAVLEPRAWTIAQSVWARTLLHEVPDGAVLELCTGVGHIGLAAVAGSGRRVVLVDRDPVAVAFARENARPLADQVTVRQAPMDQALAADERFALVVADPPWVPTAQVDRHPQDPRGAIDGGPDGLRLARECLEVIGRHLVPGGQAVLQIGTPAQAQDLVPAARAAGLRAAELQTHDRGVLLRLMQDSGGV